MSGILAVDVTNIKPTTEVQEEPQGAHEPEEEPQGAHEQEEAEEEVKEIAEPQEEQLFEKPKPIKKKRQMTEKQLASLAKAREKSMERRKALKETKDLDRMDKKLARDKKREEVLAKRMESDAVLEMKAKLMADAKANATWDEARLSKLMETTIEKYVEKRKAQKPVPKVQLPAQNAFPQYAPHYHPQPQQRRPRRATQQGSDPVSALFGYNQGDMYGFD